MPVLPASTAIASILAVARLGSVAASRQGGGDSKVNSPGRRQFLLQHGAAEPMMSMDSDAAQADQHAAMLQGAVRIPEPGTDGADAGAGTGTRSLPAAAGRCPPGKWSRSCPPRRCIQDRRSWFAGTAG
jgi:hypothetical protein